LTVGLAYAQHAEKTILALPEMDQGILQDCVAARELICVWQWKLFEDVWFDLASPLGDKVIAAFHNGMIRVDLSVTGVKDVNLPFLCG